MAMEVVQCPHCQGSAVVKYGTASNGKARYRCQQDETCGRTFIRAYAYLGCLPEVKRQIVEMTLNGNGVRDIARQSEPGDWRMKKKASTLSPVNNSVLAGCCPDALTIAVSGTHSD